MIGFDGSCFRSTNSPRKSIWSAQLFYFQDNRITRHTWICFEDGEPVANVSIELVDPESNSALKSSISDEYGRYVIDSVLVKEYELHVSKTGYQTVILSFKPEPIGISPITMVAGMERGLKMNYPQQMDGQWKMQ